MKPAKFLLNTWGVVLWLAAFSCFSQPAELRPWTNYQVIMWVGDSAYKQPDKLPLFFQRLRDLGVTTAMVHNDGNPQPLVDNRFPYYLENIVNRGLCLKWNSKVVDWDKFVTDWARGGRPASAFVRDYCLDDPQWLDWARAETRRLVRKNMANSPLAYDIRDELSTTISANPFDYDYNPITLAAFRAWLKTQYADLAALNAQWDTRFASWDDVLPFSTDQIKNRMGSGDALPRGNPDWQAVQRLQYDPERVLAQPIRWNFSPWCDFRTYMDISLARALDSIRQAAHEADPRTPVGIEGTQMPHAFGGYDLWRLSQVLDWVEPYDIGNAREIFGSFMPGKPQLCTVGESDAKRAQRRLWHLLLLGDKGCIIWWSEDCIDWKSAEYALTPKARSLAPVFQELTSPVARLFMRARRIEDPIAIHYSQASIQVAWLLESTVDGSTWPRRFSSFESAHNRHAKVRNGWVKVLQDLGYTPQFVSAAQIESGELVRAGFKTVVLPSSFALSPREREQLDAFASAAGFVYCSDRPGVFNAHGRPASLPGKAATRSWPDAASFRLSSLSGQPVNEKPGDIAAYPGARSRATPDMAWARWLEKSPGAVPLEVTVPLESRTRIHRYQLGRARLLAFERGVDYHMSEDLKQKGGNESLEVPIALQAALARRGHIYDLRSAAYLGESDKIAFTLDPWHPSLFAVLDEKVPEKELMAFLARQ